MGKAEPHIDPLAEIVQDDRRYDDPQTILNGCAPPIVRVDVPYSEEPTLVRLMTDTHCGCRACDDRQLHRDLGSSVDNGERIIHLGDVGDLIYPDDKRYTAENSIPGLHEVNDIRRAYLDYISDVFRPAIGRFDVVLTGNHEFAVQKRKQIDIAADTAKRLHAMHGGMICVLVYRWMHKNGKCAGTCALLLYHGAWSPGVGGIPPAAFRFASRFEGWDVFAFGHDHSEDTAKRGWFDIPRAGNYVSRRERRIVACGGYRRTLMCGSTPGHDEIKGFGPATIGSPLLEMRPRHLGGRSAWNEKMRSQGVPNDWIDVKLIS
jgi:hypothetical protein